jgi:hypothetical protein
VIPSIKEIKEQTKNPCKIPVTNIRDIKNTSGQKEDRIMWGSIMELRKNLPNFFYPGFSCEIKNENTNKKCSSLSERV